MAKSKLKTFRVQKRFEVWVETRQPGADFNDSTEIAGFGVNESW